LTELEINEVSKRYSSDLFGYSSVKNVVITHVMPFAAASTAGIDLELIPLSPKNLSSFLLRAKQSPKNFGDK
jgi:hypothetical protein